MNRTLVLSCLFLSSFASAQVTFSGTAYEVNQAPGGSVTGDFNRDGRPDFANIAGGNTLTIYLNTGTGKIAKKAQYGVVTNDNGTKIDTADMNGDGKLDIVIGKQYTPEFEIWYGNGDGTFRFGKDVSSNSPDTYDFTLADVNNDGKVDVLTLTNDDSQSYASVYLNDGAANFTSAAGVTFPAFVDNWAAADFDRDGKLDIVARMGTQLQEYSGNGSGGFSLHKTSTVAAGSGVVAVGSFNHDAVPDLALLIENCGTRTCDASAKDKLYVYLNDGTGHFGLRSSYTAGIGFADLATGDLNGDGVQDILFANRDFINNTAVPFQEMLNTGDGHFTGPYSAGSYTGQIAPAVRDLNLDGRRDLVLPASLSAYVLLNKNAAITCAPPSSAVLNARICGPANNATVTKTFTVKGSGNSPAGVVRMELWVDGKKSSEVWNDQIKSTISAARHRISVVAVDRFGGHASKVIYVQAQ